MRICYTASTSGLSTSAASTTAAAVWLAVTKTAVAPDLSCSLALVELGRFLDFFWPSDVQGATVTARTVGRTVGPRSSPSRFGVAPQI